MLYGKPQPGEIHWEAPFGNGRPGWHIECSVMATKYLGKTIDIHAGGQDLEFPHHENEIAQSEAETGQKFVNYWMHNGFVTIGEEDEKMSKSLGNFVTVHDLLKKVDPQVVRFFMATTQYRHPIRYSQANLAEAKTNLQKLKTAVDNLRYRKNDAEKSDVETEIREKFSALKNRFIEAMDDDFNTQNGIAVIYEMAKLLNVYSEKATVSLETIEYLLDGFSKAAEVFVIKFEEETELLDEKIEALIEERIAARKARNFARSDEIRDMLKEKGVILEDTPQGTRWKRA